MKIQTNFIFHFTRDRANDRIHGWYNPAMGHSTHLWLNGEPQDEHEEAEHNSGSLYQRIPVEGDQFSLSIPSGWLGGKVTWVYWDQDEPTILHVHVDGLWQGKFGGLEGGLSCYGTFEHCAAWDTPVESSWGSMQWAAYKAIRDLRGCGWDLDKLLACRPTVELHTSIQPPNQNN